MLKFAMEYFNDALEEAYESQKLILVIYADLDDQDNGAFLTDIFQNLQICDEIAQNFIIFGVGHRTQEAQHISNEFNITQAPYVAAIMPINDSEYNLIEEFKEDL